MSDNVQVVTDLPVKSTSVLKKVAKRTLIASAVIGVAAVAYLKTRSTTQEPQNAPEPSSA